MSKLTRAISAGKTQEALKIIRYRDMEALIALVILNIINVFISPIVYLIARFVGGSQLEFSDVRLSYLDFAETANGHSPGYRPVHLAAISGDVEVLQALHMRGVNINEPNSGRTPLLYALGNEKPEAAVWLLDHRAHVGPDILFSMINSPANMVLLDRLIARGADVNASRDVRDLWYAPGGDLMQGLDNVDNLTVLLQAVLSNYDNDYATITRLLRAGAAPNAISNIAGNPETALSVCLRKNRFKMAVVLMRDGASLDITGYKQEYWPSRETQVPIFNRDMLQMAFNLAVANHIHLNSEQTGQYTSYYQTVCAEVSDVPIASYAPITSDVMAEPPSILRPRRFLAAFRLHSQQQNSLVPENNLAPAAEVVFLDSVPSSEAEIIVPPAVMASKLKLRAEKTFWC